MWELLTKQNVFNEEIKSTLIQELLAVIQFRNVFSSSQLSKIIIAI
jgi:hypothetical protein